MVNDVNRERFEELAKLKGMDVTRANRRITDAAWWGWQEAMKDGNDD